MPPRTRSRSSKEEKRDHHEEPVEKKAKSVGGKNQIEKIETPDKPDDLMSLWKRMIRTLYGDGHHSFNDPDCMVQCVTGTWAYEVKPRGRFPNEGNLYMWEEQRNDQTEDDVVCNGAYVDHDCGRLKRGEKYAVCHARRSGNGWATLDVYYLLDLKNEVSLEMVKKRQARHNEYENAYAKIMAISTNPTT